MFRNTFLLSARLASFSLARPATVATAVRTQLVVPATARSSAFAHCGLRAFSTEPVDDRLLALSLYPKEVTLSSYLNFCAKRRSEAKTPLTLMDLGAEWKSMSAAEKAKFPVTNTLKQAPKVKSEIYPKTVKVTSLSVFKQANADKTAAAIRKYWAAMTPEDRAAEFPPTTAIVEKAPEGADFDHFFRIHSKEFMKTYLIGDKDSAREELAEVWESMSAQQQSAYTL